MTARNKPPAHRIYNRSGSPLLLHLPVQAGATQAIKKGEICKLRDPSDLSTYPIIPATTDDTGFVPLIANEEQKATDAARVMQFILPTPDVAFEFALNTATAVKMGDKIAIHDSQTVKVASSNAVGAAVAAPLADSTWQSVSACFVVFGLARAEAVKYFPFAGSAVAGAVDGLADMDDVGSISYTDTAILVADGDSYEEVTLSGAITMTNAGVTTIQSGVVANSMLADKVRKLTFTAMGTLGIDNDGARTNGGGVHGGSGVTLTEQTAALAKIQDGASYANLSASAGEAGYTGAYQLFPDSPAADDRVYFGGAVPFCELAIDMSATVQTYDEAGVLAWEYWDGSSWSALTIVHDGTGSTAQTGQYFAEQDGAMSFVPPSDWAACEVDGQEAYWIRAEIQADKADNITQVGLTNSKEHELVTPTDAFLCPNDGVVTALRLSDFASTLHTTADVKFVLVNFTTGACTAALTFAQDIAVDYWSGLSLAVSAGDALGVLVTQEDGTNEVTNAVFEATVTVA